jgi:hypothetical protein
MKRRRREEKIDPNQKNNRWKTIREVHRELQTQWKIEPSLPLLIVIWSSWPYILGMKRMSTPLTAKLVSRGLFTTGVHQHLSVCIQSVMMHSRAHGCWNAQLWTPAKIKLDCNCFGENP